MNFSLENLKNYKFKMAFIGSLPVSDVEKAFGLNAGDIKLIDDPSCSELLKNNAWTKYEGSLLTLLNLIPIRQSSFARLARMVVWLGSPIFDFPEGGKSYNENVVYGLFRLYNLHAEYRVLAYINENCRLVQPVLPWDPKDKKIEKMTDLTISTFTEDQLKKTGNYAWYLEGPAKEEFLSDKDNFGKVLVEFKPIDFENDIGFLSPRWLKNRVNELTKKE
uniref:Uncharacterized protein n=1 Tax=Clytia hemisphaerica TaxID=252671 RepID=A0A7M6DK64_9CNID|eukprot:TCONS_00014610-protein